VPPVGTGFPRCGGCQWPLPWIAGAGDDSFHEIAETAHLPVLINLWAPWGLSCQEVGQSLQRLARELSGQVKLVQVNVDDAPEVAERFAVRAVPTLLVLCNGEVTARHAGTMPLPLLRAWLNRAIR
jgi:thioredoxin 2